jgi:hypothetical protein
VKTIVTSSAVLLLMVLFAFSGTGTSVPENQTGKKASHAAFAKMQERIVVVDRKKIERRSPRTRPNKEIIDNLRKRGAITPQREKDKIAFFTSFENKKVLDFNGKNSLRKSTIDDMRSIHHAFNVSDPNGVMPDDEMVDQIAGEWWHKNQKINYMPLRVSLMNYYKMETDPSKDKDGQLYFAVNPYFNGASSQLITFGFEDEFFTTNTALNIQELSLNVEGIRYILSRKSVVAVPFSKEGVFPVVVEAKMSDGSVLLSSFDFSIKSLDGVWTNSKNDEAGNLDFIY